MTGIDAAAAYVPSQRITAEELSSQIGRFRARGIEEKAVPSGDEDSLTMAYEAGRLALDAAGSGREHIEWLAFASSTPPLDEHDFTPHLATMLGLRPDASTHTFAGSTRAGTRAIWAGIDAIEASGGPGTALVVAADAPRAAPDDPIEHAAGAGGAAFVLSRAESARFIDRAEYSIAYPGTRFRPRASDRTSGLDIGSYERQAFTETIEGAVDRLAPFPDPDVVAIQAPDGKLPYRAAKALEVDTETVRSSATVHELGDLGAASVPVTIAVRLAEAPETVLGVGYGSGSAADAFVIEGDVDDPVSTDLSISPGRRLEYDAYLRQRGVLASDPPTGGGAYVSIPTWKRSISQRYRLEAGRCRACDARVFPPEGACPECGAPPDYERVELPCEGEIETVTRVSQGGSPPEFLPLQSRSGAYATAIVVFGDGDRSVSVPAMVASGTTGDVSTGDPVRATIRRIYTQEGVTRYGFKVTPEAAISHSRGS